MYVHVLMHVYHTAYTGTACPFNGPLLMNLNQCLEISTFQVVKNDLNFIKTRKMQEQRWSQNDTKRNQLRVTKRHYINNNTISKF